MKSSQIEIVPYYSTYQIAYKSLNIEWIERYFKVEAADLKVLDYPKENILNKGGYIAIALLNGNPVGTCALIKMENTPYDYELAKMAVSPKAQGLGIGLALGQHIIAKAKELGAKDVFLESNTLLRPAITLYHKLGFKKVDHIDTPYNRCNIQMALLFKQD